MKISLLVQKSLTPLFYAALSVMILSAGFLGYKGLATAVWPGILMFVVSPFLFPFLMIPTAFFAGMMKAFAPKPLIAKAMAVCSVLYLCLLLPFYASAMMRIADPLLRQGAEAAAFTFAAGAALAPWALFASRDRANLFFTGIVLMAGLAVALMGGMIFVFGIDDMAQLFAGGFCLMATLCLLQYLYELKFLTKK